MPEESIPDTKAVITAKQWGTIITTIIGAVILGLQGMNLSSVSQGNQNGEKRGETLEQLLALSKSMDASLQNQTRILENGSRLLDANDKAFQRQALILDTLKQAIAERKELLEEHLRKITPVMPTSSP